MEPYAYWIIAGLALCIIELIAPSFIFIFFGIAALLVGGIKWLGIINHTPYEMSLFAVLSVAQFIAYQKYLKPLWGKETRGRDNPDPTGIIGQRARVLDPITNGCGSVSFRGASWQAQSPVNEIPQGTWVIIQAMDGLWLTVTPLSESKKP